MGQVDGANTGATELVEASKTFASTLDQPGRNTRLTDRYRRIVLQGKQPNAADRECAPLLADPTGFIMFLARQPWGTVPVLSFDKQDDFKLALRCLAFRCEDVNLPATVHSQAISGLPHWGLIREIDSKCRCQMLLLHRAPTAPSLQNRFLVNQMRRHGLSNRNNGD